jgi:hypothetical protein
VEVQEDAARVSWLRWLVVVVWTACFRRRLMERSTEMVLLWR